jgi:putative redox protein
MTQAKPHVASVHLVGHTGYVQEIRARHHALRSDEYGIPGGEDAGPTPVELLLAGLGACTATTLRMYAERKGWSLGEIRVDLRLVEEGGSPRIERRIRFGAEVAEDAQRRLLEIAGKTPVTRMVAQATPVETRLG